MNDDDAGEPPEDPEGSERGAVGGEVREWSADGYEPYERLLEARTHIRGRAKCQPAAAVLNLPFAGGGDHPSKKPQTHGLLPSPLSFAPPQTTPLNALKTPLAPPISRSNRSGLTRVKS
jgi:hypothetical protein